MCIAVDIIGFRNFGKFFTVSLRPFIYRYVENKIFPYAVTPKRKAIS
jgi:hypothetical protein